MILRVDFKEEDFDKVLKFVWEKGMTVWQSTSGLKMFRVYNLAGEFTGKYRSYLYDDVPPQIEDKEGDWPLIEIK